jgi:hypothetical protein
MGSMFSSPSKQAQSAASAEQGISDTDIAAAEKYVNTQEGNLRAAIPSGASNPYLNAAAGLSPSAMPVMGGSPTPTPAGSISGPITPGSAIGSMGNPFAPAAPATGATLSGTMMAGSVRPAQPVRE